MKESLKMIIIKAVTTLKNTVFRKAGHEIVCTQYLQLSKNMTCRKILKENIQKSWIGVANTFSLPQLTFF